LKLALAERGVGGSVRMCVETVRQERASSEAAKATAAGLSRWFAVKVQPRREALAELHLKKQGFETFAPKIVAPRIAAARSARALRSTAGLAPLFPGYLFVQLDLGVQRWRSINGTIGVSYLVQFGDAPAAAPIGLVEGLRARTGASSQINFDEDLTIGDSVRIVGGAFDGWIGRLKECDARGRVAVLLEAFATQKAVRFPRGSIVRAA
jgi:transcription elongation factor/antiterminator RfaH